MALFKFLACRLPRRTMPSFLEKHTDIRPSPHIPAVVTHHRRGGAVNFRLFSCDRKQMVNKYRQELEIMQKSMGKNLKVLKSKVNQKSKDFTTFSSQVSCSSKLAKCWSRKRENSFKLTFSNLIISGPQTLAKNRDCSTFWELGREVKEGAEACLREWNNGQH